ncbi:hypothetical protein CGZ80_14600 [Rhodopirellula sp. MGV]|nr:hypothetical protein CGZ80_14600 [Rhodopirellula sp. MGV]PNY36892.1 hypothetical protein C2E31_10560 [Rhodopirellula baltica]PNY37232.1 hypothetical protein C2E31_08715 [Rhodopirellula baltica]
MPTFESYAVRGVRSCPRVYEDRGGFKPHQIGSTFDAVQNLKSMINSTPQRGRLNETALRWQLGKDKVDGYFLSCGTSKAEAYDGYPFVYRFDFKDVSYLPWYKLESIPFNRDAVEKCYLFTDAPRLDGATKLVLFCLTGGFNRKKEALVMSPVKMDERCTILDKKTGKYLSLDEWKRNNDPAVCKCDGCSRKNRR